MIISFLKIVYRNIIRRKIFALINIFGLAFGITACLVIYLYVSYENSYDKFNVNAENIYRLKNVRYYTSGTDSSAGCVALLGPMLKEEIPEVSAFTRVRKIESIVTANDRIFKEKNVFWVDSSFLTMFSFPLIYGVDSTALVNKNSAVLTISTAQKYFGEKNAIGETISLAGKDFKITGITENVPPNSHIKFDILLSFDTQITERFCWACNQNNTYIQVIPGTKKLVIEAKLPVIVNKLHDRKKDGFNRAYFLQPLKDIHLYSHLRFEHEKNGNAKTVYFLSLTALLILLIAWVNYVNLSTARSIERAKEVGLRKVVGASIWSLIRQFLIESFIINVIAVFISLIIVELTYPYWSVIIGMPASFSLWKNNDLIVLLLVLIFISPLISGIYPAFVLSSYSPISILRGSFKSSFKGIFLRKGLVIFQFTISIILLVVLIVFNRQVSFMRNKNLGIDIKQKLVVNAPSKIQNGTNWETAFSTFINELQNKSLIEDATFSSVIPGMENGDVTGGVRQGKQQYEQGKQVYFVYVGKNFLDFFDINLVCGRNFFNSELKGLYQSGYNAKGLIINESAVKEFGFYSPQDAIGASIYVDNGNIGDVIGVIKDYHQQSLDKEIEPTIFEGVTSANYFVFNIGAEHILEKLEGINNYFVKIFPGNPFEYNFLDEFFDRQYKSDIQTAEILGIFTFLSIFISCLGLVGLSSLIILHRTKEIGIRKVLGASIKSLLVLLSKEFVKWLLFANIIAWPIAYYLMNKWLEDFAYRINLTLWLFLFSGIIAFFIAVATVSYQSIKAAQANPVESLKYE